MIKRNRTPRLAMITLGAMLPLVSASGEGDANPAVAAIVPIISEHFNTLDNWKPLEFPLANKSEYTLTGDGYLRASADDSVSAIVLTERFQPAEAPNLSWRWNVHNTFQNGNAECPNGDDFPMRVSVCFKFDPAKVSANERRLFKMQKLVWGEYPPYRVLHYVFASRDDLPSRVIDCPYSKRARVIVQRSGTGDTGQWHEESVDIMADFEEAFGETPPVDAVISVMADGDNTNEASTAYLDWIEVSH